MKDPVSTDERLKCDEMIELMIFTAPNALGDTSVLRERWLREVFEQAASESSAKVTMRRKSHATGDTNTDDPNLDQNAAIALLKEINSDLTTGRIRQKMAVNFQNFQNKFHLLVLNHNCVQY